MRRILCALALAAAAATAFGGAPGCGTRVLASDLTESIASANALASDFREAFAALRLDAQPGTTSTVGATLVGSAMANEAAAVLEGLRQMVRLRDQLYGSSAAAAAASHLDQAMAEAAERMRRISMGYGASARMTGLEHIRGLAAQGMLLTDGLASQWSCR